MVEGSTCTAIEVDGGFYTVEKLYQVVMLPFLSFTYFLPNSFSLSSRGYGRQVRADYILPTVFFLYIFLVLLDSRATF